MNRWPKTLETRLSRRTSLLTLAVGALFALACGAHRQPPPVPDRGPPPNPFGATTTPVTIPEWNLSVAIDAKHLDVKTAEAPERVEVTGITYQGSGKFFLVIKRSTSSVVEALNTEYQAVSARYERYTPLLPADRGGVTLLGLPWQGFMAFEVGDSRNRHFLEEYGASTGACLIGLVFQGTLFDEGVSDDMVYWTPRLVTPLDPAQPVGGVRCAPGL